MPDSSQGWPPTSARLPPALGRGPMIGLRAADAPTILRLCGDDQRLFLRLGNLLQERLAVTEAVLAEVAEHDGLRPLLMDRQLKTVTPGEAAAAVIARHCGEDSGLVLFADGVGESGWRVLAWEDERDNPLVTSAETTRAASGLDRLLPQLSERVRQIAERFLAADGDSARAAALEQLRFLDPPLALLAELMPLAVGDGAPRVRDATRALLGGGGVHPLVLELVQALEHEGEEHALEPLLPAASELAADQARLVLAALAAHLAGGRAAPTVLALIEALAAEVVASPELPRILELLLSAGRTLALLPVVRRLQAIDGGTIDRVLTGLLGRGPGADARVLALLFRAGPAIEDHAVERAVRLLLSPGDEPRERMGLAAALHRLERPGDLVARLAEAGPALVAHRDTAVFWLLGELLATDAVTADHAEPLLTAVRTTLDQGTGPQVTAILEYTLLPRLATLVDRVAAVTEPLADLAANRHDPHSFDLVAHNLAALDHRAGERLWTVIAEHPSRRARDVAIEALPAVAASLDPAATVKLVDRLVAQLEEEDDTDRRGRLLAVAAGLVVDLDGSDLGQRLLVLDQRAIALGPAGLDARGHLGAARACDPTTRARIIEDLLALVSAEVGNTAAIDEHQPLDGEVTLILDPSLSAHTEHVPILLAALCRIGEAEACPRPLRRRIVATLTGRWQAIVAWDVIWAPGNVHELVRVLTRLGTTTAADADLRRRIVSAMKERFQQPQVAIQAGRILAADQSGELAGLAGGCATRLLALVGDDRYLDDEQGDVVTALAGFLLLDDLGEDGDRRRRQLAIALTGRRRFADSTVRQRLRAARGGFEPVIQERLAWL